MRLTPQDRAQYKKIKENNDAVIEKYCRTHQINCADLKKSVKYCLYENLKPLTVCNKSILYGKKVLYHYHFRRQCVIEYTIAYIGKCYIPVIKRILTEEKAHKRYKRNVKH